MSENNCPFEKKNWIGIVRCSIVGNIEVQELDSNECCGKTVCSIFQEIDNRDREIDRLKIVMQNRVEKSLEIFSKMLKSEKLAKTILNEICEKSEEISK